MKEGNSNTKLINIMFRIQRIFRQEMFVSKKISSLSLLQLEILGYLNRNNQAQMHEIADYFCITRPTASSHLDKLNTMHLTERRINGKDRRIVHILLTRKGRTLLQEGLKRKNRHMNRILTYLPVRDKQTLLKIMNRLIHVLEKKYE